MGAQPAGFVAQQDDVLAGDIHGDVVAGIGDGIGPADTDPAVAEHGVRLGRGVAVRSVVDRRNGRGGFGRAGAFVQGGVMQAGHCCAPPAWRLRAVAASVSGTRTPGWMMAGS